MPEKKSWVEIILMPLVVVLIGSIGTWLITQQQEKNARLVSRSQIASAEKIAKADLQVKVLDMFSTRIASADDNQRILGLKMLSAVDPVMAAKLASVVAETEPAKSEVQKVAQQVASDARALPARVYIHIRQDEDRPRALVVEQILETRGFTVPDIIRVGRNSPQTTELRYFHETERQEASQIVYILKSTGLPTNLKYIDGYETASSVGPRHYELWISPGRLPD